MRRKGIARPAAGIKMTRRNSEGSDMESLHLPHAIMLVLVGEKPKAKRRKRSGSAGGESSRPRMDRARRQAGGGMPTAGAAVGPRGMPLPVQYRGPGLPQAPLSAADVQRARLLALQRARGGI
jgi:hypothetical protein